MLKRKLKEILLDPYTNRRIPLSTLDLKTNNGVVVSLTTYGKRLETVDITIRSLFFQTVRPNLIILYLAKGIEKKDIPPTLWKLTQHGLKIVFNCEDLAPHKKYFWALQDYPSSTVITVDDDVIYPPTTIASLLKTHRKFPNSIVARRVHQITFANNQICAYKDWNFEYKCQHYPSNDLVAIGVGGVLYPAGILPASTFDIKGIRQTSLYADDLWLKVNESLAGIKTVWAPALRPHPFQYLPETDTGLYQKNLLEGKNDIQLNNIFSYFKKDGSIFKK